MKIAIMQPYFLPYIGYWQLIKSVDTFVIYDNIEFSKSGWFHRNNILLNDKKILFSIPIKKDLDTLVVDKRYLAKDSHKEIQKILAQIKNSYRQAPYFKSVFPMLERIFLYEEKNLFKYISHSINTICSYLNIDTNIVISSSIKIDHSLKSQKKVIAINKALNAKVYINPIGGMKLYSKQDFKKENIELYFLESNIPRYRQFCSEFLPFLSIIDVMMFNSQEQIVTMLKEYELIYREVYCV